MNPLSIPCIAMASVNLYVSGYYLFFYAKRPQIREHLPFAFLCLSVGLYAVFSAGLYNSRSLLEGIRWQRLQLDTVAAISVSLIWFIAVFTGQRTNRILRLSVAMFVAILLASALVDPEYTLSPDNPAVKNIELLGLLRVTYYEAEVGIVYQAEIVVAVLAYLYLCLLLIRHYRKTRYGALLFIVACQIAYFIGVVNDSLVAVQAYSFIYLSEYTFFGIVVAMAYTLLDRFVGLHRSFEELNLNLEQKVLERTQVIEGLNDQLKHLAERDGLTGVYNRRFFNEYLAIEVKRAAGYLEHRAQLAPGDASGMNFGLAIIDIDHFKSINDGQGHLAGDGVLKQVAEIMERDIFSRDVLCRYGGDEFALLLTKTSSSGILQAAEKIRREIAEHEFVVDAKHARQHVTVSVGLAIFDEAPGTGGEEILRLADDRLLRAKVLGRNRIVYSDSQ